MFKLLQDVVLIGLLLTTVSCGVQRSQSIQYLNIERSTADEEGILFVEMLFSSNTPNYEVRVASLNLTSGKLKPNYRSHSEEAELAVILQGRGMSDTVFFHNPLTQHFEEYSEDGEIKRKEVQLEEAMEFVRMTYNKSYNRLIIRDMINGENKYICAIQ